MDYVERLEACGISPDDALFVCDEFLSEGDLRGLEIFVSGIEVEHEWRRYVEEIQSESCR